MGSAFDTINSTVFVDENSPLQDVANTDISNNLLTPAKADEYQPHQTPSKAVEMTASHRRPYVHDQLAEYAQMITRESQREAMFEQKWWLFKPGQS